MLFLTVFVMNIGFLFIQLSLVLFKFFYPCKLKNIYIYDILNIIFCNNLLVSVQTKCHKKESSKPNWILSLKEKLFKNTIQFGVHVLR
jgi:hypothetical protein